MNWYKRSQNKKLRKRQLEELAKKEFGETFNILFAGFLLQDGTLLNFSEGGYQRDLDHRSVSGLEGIEEQYTFGMYEFMNITGAIRINCHPTSLGIHIMSPPTFEQMNVISKNLKYFKEFYIDIQNESGEKINHMEYMNPGRLNSEVLLEELQEAYTEDFSNKYDYPPEIYQAYNRYYGSNTSPEDIDTMNDGEVMGAASMSLPGGRDEFRKLLQQYRAKQAL